MKPSANIVTFLPRTAGGCGALVIALALSVPTAFAQRGGSNPPETTPAGQVPGSSTQQDPRVKPNAPTGQNADQTNPLLPPTRKPTATSAGSNPSDSTASSTPDANSAYLIGALDVLSIQVWNNPNLTKLYDVQPDGVVSMPLIGEVKADGLTREQLKTAITGKLTEFFNNPEVDIQVVKVNSKRYYVLGEVDKPGEYPLLTPTTVLEAISNCGGFRDFANPKKIYVLRANGGGTARFNFNYKDVSKGKHQEENILLQNGDKIFVP